MKPMLKAVLERDFQYRKKLSTKLPKNVYAALCEKKSSGYSNRDLRTRAPRRLPARPRASRTDCLSAVDAAILRSGRQNRDRSHEGSAGADLRLVKIEGKNRCLISNALS